MKYSKYQLSIFEHIKKNKEHLLVNAVAGAGKTFTILKSLDFIQPYEKCIFLSFNTHIAKELKSKVPDHVRATTLHSFGCNSMYKYYGKYSINPNKIIDICVRIIDGISPKVKWQYYYQIQKLVDLFRQDLAQTRDDLLQIAIKHNIDMMGFDIEKMLDDSMNVFSVALDDTGQFDFTDMVYVPAMNDSMELEKFDVVFVDEVQDLNVAQFTIVNKIVKKGGRMICIGDERQSIYGFAGADAESFYKFSQIKGIKQLPLSVSYRCSKSVVREAQKIVSHIEYSETAVEGKVSIASYKDIEYGDWVLCRNTKPLVILCIYLIKKKQKAHIKGDEIGKSMIHMLKRINEPKFKLALGKLNHQVTELKEKLKSLGVVHPDYNEQVVAMNEKIEIIEYLGEGNNSVEKVLGLLQSIFKNDEAGIKLSTIHKAKGLENDRVFILCPELMPSKYAVQPWQQVQEQNLRYVAITRARSQLFYVKDFDKLIEKQKKNDENR